MRKLKKFTLAEGHELSAAEMAILEGGDFLPFDCQYQYAPCAVFYETGIYTGTCQYGGDVVDGKPTLVLTCHPN